MSNYQLQFHMTSQDYTQKFETTAKKVKQTLRFKEPNGDTHIITFKKSGLLYQKKGSRSMTYHFDKGIKTKGYYEIEGISLEFDIVTTSLEITTNTITVLFDLFQKNEKINSMTLHIWYDALKEEYNAKQ